MLMKKTDLEKTRNPMNTIFNGVMVKSKPINFNFFKSGIELILK